MNFLKRCNLLIEELAGIYENKHFREHFLYEFASTFLGITKQQCSTINYALRYKVEKKNIAVLGRKSLIIFRHFLYLLIYSMSYQYRKQGAFSHSTKSRHQQPEKIG